MDPSAMAGLVAGATSAVLGVVGTAVTVYRHIDRQTEQTREVLRRETNDRFAGIERQVSQLATTGAQRDEMVQGDRHMAESLDRLADRVERVSVRLEVLAGVQAETRANGELLRELVRAVGAHLPGPAAPG